MLKYLPSIFRAAVALPFDKIRHRALDDSLFDDFFDRVDVVVVVVDIFGYGVVLRHDDDCTGFLST